MTNEFEKNISIETNAAGIPARVTDHTEVNADGHILIYSLAAAGGDRDRVHDAMQQAADKYGANASEVYINALAHFSFQLAPLFAELAKDHSGVDVSEHFEEGLQRQRQILLDQYLKNFQSDS